MKPVVFLRAKVFILSRLSLISWYTLSTCDMTILWDLSWPLTSSHAALDKKTDVSVCEFYDFVRFNRNSPHVQICQSRRLPDGISIFTAELVTLLWALWWVEERGLGKIILCTDSLSALMALGAGEGGRTRPDIVGEILMMVFKLERQGCSVAFLWVPAHTGVEGNEVADRAARTSSGRESVDLQVPFGRMEYRSIISERLDWEWQQEWDGNNRVIVKLYSVHPSVKPGNRVNLPRIDETKWTRLRLGHCGLASGLMLVGKHRDGNCEHCGVLESVQHVLMLYFIYRIGQTGN